MLSVGGDTLKEGRNRRRPMETLRNMKPRRGTGSEVEGLLRSAEQQFPGITDLLKVYGGYEEMIREVQQYVEATRQEPFITTSNRSDIPY